MSIAKSDKELISKYLGTIEANSERQLEILTEIKDLQAQADEIDRENRKKKGELGNLMKMLELEQNAVHYFKAGGNYYEVYFDSAKSAAGTILRGEYISYVTKRVVLDLTSE